MEVNNFTPSSYPKNILYVHSSDELYGSDIVLWQLISNLDRKLYEPIVVVPTDIRYEGKLSARLRGCGIKFYSIKMGVLRRRYFSPWGFILFLGYLAYGTWKIAGLIKRHRIDLVHSSTSAVMGGAFAARIYKIPHVWHIHEVIEKPHVLAKFIYPFILANASRVVAVSKPVANCFKRAENSTKIDVIYNGIDCSVFNPNRSGQQVRDEFGFDNNQIVIGMVGRISHQKGQELLMEAMAQSIEVNQNLRLLIVGDPIPGEECRLEKTRLYAHKLGLDPYIYFIPFRSDIPEIMRALDILVLPSTLPESLGLVALEAMASERPVIAAAHGGSLDTVEHNKTGLLFPPGDKNSLAEAIIYLASKPEMRERMGKTGRQRVIDHFSLEQFLSYFNHLYADLLSTR